MAIHWVGKDKSSDMVGRGGSVVNMSETRWIVPVRPYQAPKGSAEKIENTVLLGAGVAAIVFGFAFMVLSAL